MRNRFMISNFTPDSVLCHFTVKYPRERDAGTLLPATSDRPKRSDRRERIPRIGAMLRSGAMGEGPGHPSRQPAPWHSNRSAGLDYRGGCSAQGTVVVESEVWMNLESTVHYDKRLLQLGKALSESYWRFRLESESSCLLISSKRTIRSSWARRSTEL